LNSIDAPLKRQKEKGVKSAFGFYPFVKVNIANPENDTILSGALICKGNMTWSIFGLGAVE
jgi:hypothetical protein